MQRRVFGGLFAHPLCLLLEEKVYCVARRMRCSRIAAFLYYINAQHNGHTVPYTSSVASVVLDKVEDVNARFARLRRQLLLKEKPWFVHTAPSASCLGRDPSARLSWLARDDKMRCLVRTLPCRGGVPPPVSPYLHFARGVIQCK